MGDAKQVADRWAHVVDLQFAAGGFGVDVQAHQRAEATAIHVGDVLKVKDDASGSGQQLADLGIEQMIQAGNQASVAVDHDAVLVALNREGETGYGLAGHSVASDARDCWSRDCYILRCEEEVPATSSQA